WQRVPLHGSRLDRCPPISCSWSASCHPIYMIALTAGRRKGVQMQGNRAGDPVSRETIHGIVSGILLLPHFRQPPAPLSCDKVILRWPGPFGSGFLSPQPPGAVGIGPVRRGSNPENWANASWSFFFLGICFRTTPLVIPQRASASFDVQLHI